jgi:ATP-binding cassette subfamily B protein
MIAIGWVINLAQRGAASFGRLRAVLDTEPAIRDQPPLEPFPVRCRARRIVLARSHAAHAGADPASARPWPRSRSPVAPGEVLASSDARAPGKSTLLSLTAAADRSASGHALDRRSRRAARRARRSARGDRHGAARELLFSASLHDNIAFGKPDASRARSPRRRGSPGSRTTSGSCRRGSTRWSASAASRSPAWAEAARGTGARAASRSADPAARRLSLGGRYADEERILGHLRVVFVGRTVILVSHRVSDGPSGGPHRGARPGTDRRVRHPRRTGGGRRRLRPSSTRDSGWKRSWRPV